MAELSRRLGFFGVLALSFTALLGTGTFLGAEVGASIADQASITSWLVIFGFSILMSFVFAELAGMFPSSGGVYEFAKQTYGRTFSFLTGWTNWLMGSVGIVALVVAALQYSLQAYYPDWVLILFACAIIIVLSIVAAYGIDASAKLVIVLTVLLLVMYAALLIPAWLRADPTAILPIQTQPYNLVFVAVFLLLETFFGYEAAAYLADETKRPRRTIPLAIIVGTIAVIALALISLIVTFALVPIDAIKDPSSPPLVDLAQVVFGPVPWIALAIMVIVALNLLASAVSGIVSMPRLLYAMAKDRLFLHQFSEVSERTKTPLKATVFQTFVLLGLLLIAFGNYTFLLELLIPLALLMYLLMVLAVPILRLRKPNAARTFKMPLAIPLSLLLAGFFVFLIGNWVITVPGAGDKLLFISSLVMLGVPLYLLVESYYDPAFITKVNNALFPILPKNRYDEATRDDIFIFLEDLEGKRVLEIGSASGRLTEELLVAVGRDGEVVASSFSEVELEYLRGRLSRFYELHPSAGRILLVHDTEHFSRIPPEVPQVDAIISSGFLSYVQDFDRFLASAAAKLSKGGRIIFVDYIHQFHVLPDPEFLSDLGALEERFKTHGFSIRVRVQKGGFHDRLIIYGVSGVGTIPFI